MAQRTGAYGLVGLAFVVAVLSGCGGGGNSSSTVASAPSNAQSQASKNGGAQEVGGSAGDRAGTDEGSSSGGTSAAKPPTKQIGGSEGPKSSGSGSSEEGKQESHPLGKSGYENEEAGPEPENIPVVNMTLFSPEVVAEAGSGDLPAKFTCDGKDVWPALKWNTPPSGTQELVLFAMNIQPVEGKLFYDWAVAGIDPEEGEIPSGGLPHGAVLGETSRGGTKYSLCPNGGKEETFLFQLFAVPKKLGAATGFDPQSLRTKALEVAPNAGLLSVYYG